ncbi:hypothetical protein KIN20_023142 [Parelaphostrongylus tenuis]|uniref:Uncharacterized protein n=1 Tax=Parelaphostrongylus tenuis TaxID=148309 RepID=A0AAD5MU68_PARTN|nr:hypothetical protein KIN20_011824 [Parelaphostrongylus tenuis]KAJ1363302.1 hypothetical protein KIN20_023142 [Parelaphostrongylus tenuis]
MDIEKLTGNLVSPLKNWALEVNQPVMNALEPEERRRAEPMKRATELSQPTKNTMERTRKKNTEVCVKIQCIRFYILTLLIISCECQY